ncbi:hypothetical protein O6H91_09G000500 [Diphasiastrum complanatum]|uniref:Uncharacterized protein n=1 Tax=Diphasiastrum complanatum TaxID=34168 RepID=A0ACC2CKX9_DIPCM|nr:hypothetical protein O6H91_09G000500 [Diphasiastrum complanatum]
MVAAMFEGFLYQFLSGYLGNYVKDIQREQFRIGLWSGYVLLENVELRVEAFDYLQLPFAIKHGSIGKLRFQVPWKKLGWEPVLIALENVYICAVPRDDAEWNPEASDRRALAAKGAKLAAAEIEKLSRRVSDEKLQKSFLTHISARIIDNIQVAITNVHIQYLDENTDSKAKFSFGLTLADLTVNNKDGRSFSSTGAVVAGKLKNYLVHKVVEIQELAVYWNSDTHCSNIPQNSVEEDEVHHLLHPVNASLKLTVNRNKTGEVGNPQYAILVNVDDLNIRLDDHQFREMVSLTDSFKVCKLREKYGRYRPHNADRRLGGWQQEWWQFAIKAVLADVRERLHRSSWTFFNWCMEQRRLYMAFYKDKLECLQQGNPIDEAVVEQLKEMEKNLNLEMILYYRTLAENLLQLKDESMDDVEDADVASLERDSSSNPQGQLKEGLPQNQRGWVSWLSLGMFGESGNLDASQLSGSFSEDLIKDLYEATNFDPTSIIDSQDWPKGYSSLAVSLHLGQAVGRLHSLSSGMDVIHMVLEGAAMTFRMWKESASFTVSLKSLEVVDPSCLSPLFPEILSSKTSQRTSVHLNGESTTALTLMRTGSESNVSSIVRTLRDGKSNHIVRVDIEIYFLHKDLDMMITVNIDPLDFVYSPNAFISLSGFFNPSKSFQVVGMGIRPPKMPQAQPYLQTEHLFPSLKRVALQVNVDKPRLVFPESLFAPGGAVMVVTMQCLHISSSINKAGVNDLAPGSSSKEAFLGSRFEALQGDDLSVGEEDVQGCNRNCDIHIKTTSMNQFQLLVSSAKVLVTNQSANWLEKLSNYDPALDFIDSFDMKAIVYAYRVRTCPVSSKFKICGSLPLLRIFTSIGKYELLKAVVNSITLIHEKAMYDRSNGDVLSEEFMSNYQGSQTYLSLGSERAQCTGLANAMSDITLEDFRKLELTESTSTKAVSGYFKLRIVVIELTQGPKVGDKISDVTLITWIIRLEELQIKFSQDPLQNAVHLLFKDLLIQNTLNHSGSSSSVSNSILSLSGKQVRLDVIWSDVHDPLNSVMHYSLGIPQAKVNNLQHRYGSKSSTLVLNANCFAETVQCSIKSLLEKDVLVDRGIAKAESFCITYSLNEGCFETWTANFLALNLFHAERSQSAKTQLSELLCCRRDDEHDKKRQECFQVLYSLFAEKRMEVTLPPTKIWASMREWNEVSSAIQSIVPLFANDKEPKPPVYHKPSPSLDEDVSSTLSCADNERQISLGSSELEENKQSIPAIESADDETSLDNSVLLKINSKVPSGQQAKIKIPDIVFVLKDFSEEGYFGLENQEPYSEKCVLISASVFVDKIKSRDNKVVLEARILKLEAVAEGKKEHRDFPCLRMSSLTIQGEYLGDLEIKEVFIVLHADSIETWCSPQILRFWHGFSFEPLGSGPSMVLDVVLRLDAHLQSASLLITDAQWSRSAPIIEFLLESIVVLSTWRMQDMETSIATDLRVNYHNMHKVAQEPLLETWHASCTISKNYNSDITFAARPFTKIEVSSSGALNINITESMAQAIFQTVEMIEDSRTVDDADEKGANVEVESGSSLKKTATLRYASYWFQNDTGVAVTYWLVRAHKENGQCLNFTDRRHDSSSSQIPNVIEPGCSVRLYIEETSEPLSHPTRSCWQTAEANEQHAFGPILHRQICFQLEGASRPSPPMSIDLVGCRSFEVVFSNSIGSSEHDVRIKNVPDPIQEILDEDETESLQKANLFSTYAVLEVTVQGYSKLIRLHSKVSLLNATSKPLEVRFDIPLGVSPKVLDLVMPGQATFLPVHLAETGKMRWRPYGSSHLWSEAQSLSNMMFSSSHYRSVVCYPVHPGSKGPFRCCLSVCQSHISLTEANMPGNLISAKNGILEKRKGHNGKSKAESFQVPYIFESSGESKEQSEGCEMCNLTLVAPLVIKNCLTCLLEISVESGAGINVNLSVPKEDSVFVYDVDVGHDLSIKISALGYLPSSMKFGRSTFLADEAQKNSHHETTFIVMESMVLQSKDVSGPPLHVRLEKMVDIMSGARKLRISVPYWLYNCTHLDMMVMDGDVDVPLGKEILLSGTSINNSHGNESNAVYGKHPFTELVGLQSILQLHNQSPQPNVNYDRKPTPDSSRHEDRSAREEEVVPHMYSPAKGSDISEHRLRARLVLPGHVSPAFKESKDAIWSRPFSLGSPVGAATVIIPNSSSGGACVMSVSATPILEAYTGKTKVVTLQPRYVLANACKKDLYFKQQGADGFHLLVINSYSHLHMDDVSRNLLVSVRYDEHGWDWSGGFAPDLLGDTQVKMHNYVTGAREIIRVEVTIASTHAADEAYVRSAGGSHGTCLIVITNDETGFMPYRIENFSMEKLRFYQQKCDKMENILYAYSSCDYAWDEPCQPHRLVIEIPGEGSLGAYGVEEIREFSAITFPARAEKPERRFLVSVRAEGPRRVLSVTDLTIHMEKGLSSVNHLLNADQSSQSPIKFTEEYSLTLACVGFSLVNSSPQELAFASAKGLYFHVQQNERQQKVTFQIDSCQVDNQLRHAAYPVMLSTSFGSSELVSAGLGNENNERLVHNESVNPVHKENMALKLVVAKWRQAAGSVDCFQFIYARISPVMLELEELHFFALVTFMKRLTSMMKGKKLVPFQSQRWVNENPGAGKWDYEVAENSNGNSLRFLKTLTTPENRWKTHIAVDYLADMIQKQVVSAKEKRKVYIEVLHIEPIELTVSFSSAPWSTKQHQLSARQSLYWATGTLRRFMALADVEGAPVQLGRLMLAHPMANWSAISGMISRHYTRQLLHEFYKVLGSADVFGNPMGFLRSLGMGVWDFFSSPARSIGQNPKELVKSFSEGTKSLLRHTIFAFSNAASQMSKAAQKGVAAFALDQDYIAELERRQQEQGIENSIVNEFLEVYHFFEHYTFDIWIQSCASLV